MIETAIPEINVIELMARIRAKTAEIERANDQAVGGAAHSGSLSLPGLPRTPAPPEAALPGPVKTRRERIYAALERAQRAGQVAEWVPKVFRSLFRKQGAHNRATLETIRLLTKANAELVQRVEQLSACLRVQQDWLQLTHSLRAQETAWKDAVAQTLQSLPEAVEKQIGSSADLRALRTDAERAGQHLRNLQEQSNQNTDLARRLEAALGALSHELDALRSNTTRNTEVGQDLQSRTDLLRQGFDTLRRDGEKVGEHVTNLQKESNRNFEIAQSAQTGVDELRAGFEALRRAGERVGEHLGNLQKESDRNAEMAQGAQASLTELWAGFDVLRSDAERAGQHLSNLQAALAVVTELRAQVNRTEEHLRNLQGQLDQQAIIRQELERGVVRLEERLITDSSFVKGELSHHRTLLQSAVLPAKERQQHANAGSDATEPSADGDAGMLDSFYLTFEDRFRGSRAEIKKRLEVYLPTIKAAIKSKEASTVVDLGCGRGEWVELLQSHGLSGVGVDLNGAMIANCQERGLQVIRADVLKHLRSLPDASVGAVTGFHIIEHLPFEILMNVLGETLRVLQPGGVAIFESPNCKNVIVGASTFNLDPTHRNPVFPESAEFMLQLQGFIETELRYLSPAEGSPFKTNEPEWAYLRERFFGPQDFSVIGYKAAR